VETATDPTTRLGGWLFRHRTWLPVPVAIAILTLRTGQSPPSAALIAAGVATTAAGELLRLWGVHQIGAISRTRSHRLGPLVDSGPFAHVRNPLYVGNVALWVGFAITARLVWLAPVVLVLLGVEYHAIVRWEEQLLESRLGNAYRSYAAAVPRWLPKRRQGAVGGERKEREFYADSGASAFSLRQTFFSERGTLIAIAAGYLLLWIKSQM
jgi:protein-S-isoprenylcysteine O-methyltransferase Ste14